MLVDILRGEGVFLDGEVAPAMAAEHAASSSRNAEKGGVPLGANAETTHVADDISDISVKEEAWH